MHVLVCWVLILKLELEVFGAAMALNITYTLNFLMQEIYVHFFLSEELSKYQTPFFS